MSDPADLFELRRARRAAQRAAERAFALRDWKRYREEVARFWRLSDALASASFD